MISQIGIAPIVSELIAGMSLLVTILAITFKLGQRYTKMQRTHEEMESAHETLHQDIASISDQINGDSISYIRNCPICGGDDDNDDG